MLDKDQITGWEDEPDAKAEKPEVPEKLVKPPVPRPAPQQQSAMAAEPPQQEIPVQQPVQAQAVQQQPVSHSGEARDTGERVTLTAEQKRARKRRSQWTALALFAFIILIFVITMARLGGGIPDRL